MSTKPETCRKRRNVVNLPEGIGMPPIPGIPISVLPFYVQAMNDTSLFLKTTPNEAVRFYRDHQHPSDIAAASTIQRPISMVADEIMTERDQDESSKLRQKAQTSISQWLNAIRICLQDSARQDGDVVNRTMEHLSSLSKRAVTHLIGRLLWKSADARKWWVDRLLEWTDSLKQRKPIWQQEAYWLLIEFNEKYGHVYSTAISAVRRLEQVCIPVLSNSSELANSDQEVSAMELRHIRDHAMSEIDKVEALLKKRIDKAYKCLDVIAPHVIQPIGIGTSRGTEHAERFSAESMNDGSGDDESDIDWEDGDGSEAHAQAVECTLRAMRATGGLIEESIEIDFASTAPNDDNLDNTRDKQARDRLQKLMEIIVGKGMPLVSRWLRALIQADTLILSAKSNKSLVQMTTAQKLRRKLTVERLMYLKQKMARLASSAQRLGVEPSLQSEKKPTTKEPTLPPGMARKRNATLRMKLSRGEVFRKRQRSNKIQIKYRTDL